MPAVASRRKALALAAVLIAGCLPAALVSGFGFSELGSAALYGTFIALAGVMYGWKTGTWLSAIGGLAGIGSQLVHPYPILGALFFGLLTAACALTARRGLHAAFMMVPMLTSFLLMSPISVGAEGSLLGSALIVGAVMTSSGLWLVAVTRLVGGKGMPVADLHGFSIAATRGYATILGSVVGISAGILLFVDPAHTSAWLLLTLVVVMQPSLHDSMNKTWQRLGGTVLGAALTIPITFGLSSFAPSVTLAIGVIAMFIAFSLRYVLKRQYWQYVAPLTVGIILLDATSATQAAVTIDRVGFTFLGSVIAIGVALVVKSQLVRSEEQGLSGNVHCG